MEFFKNEDRADGCKPELPVYFWERGGACDFVIFGIAILSLVLRLAVA